MYKHLPTLVKLLILFKTFNVKPRSVSISVVDGRSELPVALLFLSVQKKIKYIMQHVKFV